MFIFFIKNTPNLPQVFCDTYKNAVKLMGTNLENFCHELVLNIGGDLKLSTINLLLSAFECIEREVSPIILISRQK